MMRFTRLVCVYMSTFLLEMLYTIHACRTRVVLGCRLYYTTPYLVRPCIQKRAQHGMQERVVLLHSSL